MRGCAGRAEPFTHLNIAPTIVLGSKRRRERRPEPRPDRNRSKPRSHVLLRGVHVRSPLAISLGAMFSERSLRSPQTVKPSLFLIRKMSLGFSSALLMPCQHRGTDITFPPPHPPAPLGFTRQSGAFTGRALIWSLKALVHLACSGLSAALFLLFSGYGASAVFHCPPG